jgi:hypothetical protein
MYAIHTHTHTYIYTYIYIYIYMPTSLRFVSFITKYFRYSAGAHLEFFDWGGGAEPEAIYHLCLIFKNCVVSSCIKYNVTLFAAAFMYTNVTTCSVTQSQCPILLFFIFINLLSKF